MRQWLVNSDGPLYAGLGDGYESVQHFGPGRLWITPSLRGAVLWELGRDHWKKGRKWRPGYGFQRAGLFVRYFQYGISESKRFCASLGLKTLLHRDQHQNQCKLLLPNVLLTRYLNRVTREVTNAQGHLQETEPGRVSLFQGVSDLWHQHMQSCLLSKSVSP